MLSAEGVGDREQQLKVEKGGSPAKVRTLVVKPFFLNIRGHRRIVV